ncbi:calcium uptake protein 3, mitochondrial isoform X1 [Metopolophium dirhodum]|uniref:calcium uptake protein 3, mitochondrial isoform X1 n=1 Tax=Metopolophium dirhodum TaxID=44670 RepID=UPI0029905AA8|nr:calcium uptake protein 3, mitochondrial isoform X1 [Metopolophium dirhodum]
MNSSKVLRCSIQLTRLHKINNIPVGRRFSTGSQLLRKYSKVAGITGAGIISIIAYGFTSDFKVYAYSKKDRANDEYLSGLHLTSREKRFIKFASVEYHGQLYMTPQDFLESFVDEQPRARLQRHFMTDKDLDEIRDKVPGLKKGSSQLFRTLRDKGIISYTEYLFLLSVLTKPQSGFRIAFNMFDTDGNHRVDKNEFLVITRLLAGKPAFRIDLNKHAKEILSQLSTKQVAVVQRVPDEDSNIINRAADDLMEKIFSQSWKDKHGVEDGKPDTDKIGADDFVDDAQGLQKKHLVDTTLIVHFFGKKGDNVLLYEDFRNFMENLQTEVLEMEFQQFAKGGDTISEMDFAKILLRYTHLDTDLCDTYLDRLLERIKMDKGIPPGISFDEFKVFCQFLNNLEDFTIAMRMYTLADHPISKDEFHRAVKICTGTSLSKHLVHTVFAIFDEDGDGQLSYREFIAIMKDRLNRGFKSYTKNEGWDAFKICLKHEIKTPN